MTPHLQFVPVHAEQGPEFTDDAAWLQRLRAGDEEAFEQLVRTFGGRMLAVARRYLPNPDDAADVVQGAFLNAFRALAAFKQDCRLSTWLHRIVVNTALMKLRTRRRKPETLIDDLLPSFEADGRHAPPASDWAVPSDVNLLRSETRAMVRACILQLPSAYREVVILRDIEERSTRETAAALRLSEAAVKVRLHRARQALVTLIRRSGVATAAVARSRAGTRFRGETSPFGSSPR